MRQIGAPQIGLAKIGAFQLDTLQFAPPQIVSVEIDFRKVANASGVALKKVLTTDACH
jgi:hypothetical protein